MEPLHITEFASPRYFDKLRSLNEAADNANANPPPPPQVADSPSQTNTLTLPIREQSRPLAQRRRRSDDNVRPSDQKRRTLGHDLSSLRTQRRPSFAGFVKSKISGGHKVSSAYVDHDGYLYEEDLKQSLTLNDLLLGLPNELQLQIIASLPMPTILNLRLVSRSFHNLVAMNESPIARYHLSQSVPAYALRLYPAPEPSRLDLQYLCGIWHRLHVAQKLAVLISEHTTKEIFLRDTEAKWNEFLPQLTRMRRRLMPLIFTMFHFFEKYRELHLQHLARGGIPLHLQPFTLNPIEKQVMNMYDDELLLAVHQVFPLVLSAFSRRLRPPSYAGRLERSIKGMMKDKPADEIYATILLIGGLRQAERFWETKGYNTRRAAVDQWYGYLTQEPDQQPQKSKLASKFSLGRKKVSVPTETVLMETPGGPQHDSASCNEWYCVKPACVGGNQSSHNYNPSPSLAAGPPMSPLQRDLLRLLLSDQQPLTNIWLHTAEAVILERKIVENSQKIKRNTQVLLELIREDGPAIEDEWAPGLSQVSRRSMQNFKDVNAFSTQEY